MIDKLEGIYRINRYYKQLTERAVEQVKERDLHKKIDGFDHSAAVLMKHISGYLRSTWTNFRTEDGEKPWRNRDSEFVDDFSNRGEVISLWNEGWDVLFEALESVKEEELYNIIYVRNEGITIMDGFVKSLAHVSYHSGQIVQISKYFAGNRWKTLSIPKGKTDEYNEKMFNRDKSIGMYKDRF